MFLCPDMRRGIDLTGMPQKLQSVVGILCALVCAKGQRTGAGGEARGLFLHFLGFTTYKFLSLQKCFHSDLWC